MTDNRFLLSPMRFEAVRLRRRGNRSFEWLLFRFLDDETGRVEDRLVKRGGVGGRLVGAGGVVGIFATALSVAGGGVGLLFKAWLSVVGVGRT